MLRSRKKTLKEEDPSGGGYCCNHCADSKFPCVRMQIGLKQAAAESKRARERV